MATTALVWEGPKPQAHRFIFALIAFGPMLLVPLAVFLGWYMGAFVWWIDLPLWIFFGNWRAFGVTLEFHRQLTHGTTFWLHPVPRMFFLIGGHLAIQTDGQDWGTVHRGHHADSDGKNDPHSPLRYVREADLKKGDPGYRKALLRGIGWAHFGWMLRSWIVDERLYSGFREDVQLQWCRRHYAQLILFSYLAPLVIGGMLKSILLINGTWGVQQFLLGALFSGIFAGVLNIWWTHHITWCVNSLCHTFGVRPFKSRNNDQSTDLPFYEYGLIGKIVARWFEWVSRGEVNHNGHHTFDWSPKHALAWKWHLDLTWYLISFLQWLGLAKVKLPSKEQIAAQRA